MSWCRGVFLSSDEKLDGAHTSDCGFLVFLKVIVHKSQYKR
jgi:hypothetical protein